MSFRIRPGEHAGREIARIFTGRLAAAVEALGTEGPKGVHDARKRLKEARALLRLARRPIGKEAFAAWNRRLRDLARLLSAQRDAAALVEAWDRLAAWDRRRFSSASMRRVRQRLEARVDAQDDAGRQRAEAATALEEARREAENWRLDGEGFALFAAGVRRSYRDGRAALKKVRRKSAHDELRHEWRKRVKDHWYQARLLQEAWPELFAPLADALKLLSDRLGEDRDLALLSSLISEQPALFGAANTRRAIVAAVLERRTQLYAGALPAGERLYAERADALTLRWGRYWLTAEREAAMAATEG